MPLYRWLDRAAGQWPCREALRTTDEALSFAALAGRVGGLARAMASWGSPLAITADSRLDLALGIQAALRLELAVLPLEKGLSERERLDLTAQCGIEGVFDCSRPAEPRSVPSSALNNPETGRRLLLLPGSGSGGSPRVAMLSHAGIEAAVLASAERLPLQPGDLWLDCLPLGHVGGLSIVLRCLQAGAGVLLQEQFDAGHLWRDLQEQPVTHVSLVPAMLHRLLEAAGGRAPPGRLRIVLVGGAALDPTLARRAWAAGWPLCVTYGMSETASQVATLCGAEAGLQAGRVGQPLPGFDLRIVDPGPGGVGRIVLRGPAVMTGYARPGLAPGLGLSGGWLATGDLGRIDREGGLEVVGRADDVLVSGGEQVHPVELEPLLQQCPGIGVAALSARRDPVWGDLLVAVYTGSASPRSVEGYCREHWRGARRPRGFLRFAELPLGRSGKLDRRRLREMVEAGFPSPARSG